MLCVLYVNVIGALLGAAALLIERVLPPASARRWVWCAVMPVSMFIPGYYRTHHNWSVIGALQQHTSALPVERASETGAFPLFDPQWWAHTETYNRAIHNFWLTASAILIAWAIANAWRVWRVVRLSRRRSNPGKPLMLDGVPVLITDAVGPATVGLVASHVLVPRWVLAMPATQRQYVVRHEEEHRRSHDGLLLFLASLPLVLAPWNLAFWWQLRRLCLAVEMDCDNRVIAALGDRGAYGALLLKVAEAGSRGPRLQPAFLGAGMLEKRMNQLLAPEPLHNLQRFIVPAAALALLALVAWMPHPISGASHAHTRVVPGAIAADVRQR